MLLTLLDLDGVGAAWIWDAQASSCLASQFNAPIPHLSDASLEATSRRMLSLFSGAAGTGDEIVIRFSEGLLFSRRDGSRLLVALSSGMTPIPALRVAAGIALREPHAAPDRSRPAAPPSVLTQAPRPASPTPAPKPAAKTRLGIWD